IFPVKKNNLAFQVTKLDHHIKQNSKAKGFSIDVEVKILGKESSPLELDCSCSVEEFIWEDDDCPEKMALYEFFIDDVGMEHD
ncbi:hypothetical protein ABTD45_19770, partial [Acinetobacter baumannii]